LEEISPKISNILPTLIFKTDNWPQILQIAGRRSSR
jgi:hypothetical protein